MPRKRKQRVPLPKTIFAIPAEIWLYSAQTTFNLEWVINLSLTCKKMWNLLWPVRSWLVECLAIHAQDMRFWKMLLCSRQLVVFRHMMRKHSIHNNLSFMKFGVQFARRSSDKEMISVMSECAKPTEVANWFTNVNMESWYACEIGHSLLENQIDVAHALIDWLGFPNLSDLLKYENSECLFDPKPLFTFSSNRQKDSQHIKDVTLLILKYYDHQFPWSGLAFKCLYYDIPDMFERIMKTGFRFCLSDLPKVFVKLTKPFQISLFTKYHNTTEHQDMVLLTAAQHTPETLGYAVSCVYSDVNHMK